jgi:hypothetical protein
VRAAQVAPDVDQQGAAVQRGLGLMRIEAGDARAGGVQHVLERARDWVGRHASIIPGVETRINPRFNPCADDGTGRQREHGRMTTTEYLINAALILVVLRQARERRLDRRALIVPLALVLTVGQNYVHTVPTSGNDLVLIALLASVGLTLGVLGGLATHVRAGSGGTAFARVGWIAGALLVAGIGARMAFALAITHGAEPAVRSFSITHHITAQAWPVALVAMALLEVVVRIGLVQVRGRRMVAGGRMALQIA